MYPRKEKRYKAFGIALVVFILITFFAVLRPRPGLSDVVASEYETDSIQIYCVSKKTVITLSNSIEIRSIIAELRKATPYHPVALKIDREIFDLKFYSNKSNNDVSFLRGTKDGLVIWAGLAGFKADGVWPLLDKYCK
jgi:hypothetical protein